MSTLWSDRVDMNMTNLLPFLIIVYAILPRKARSIPITKSLGERITEPRKDYSDDYFDVSEGLVLQDEPETKIKLDSAPLDVSRNSFISPPGLGKKNKATGGDSVAPEYMLDLYNRFSRNNLDLPASNIVRSFKNVNLKDGELDRTDYKDVGAPEGTKSQVHVLTFNISSIARREKVSLAELRLFTLIEQDKNAYYFGVDRTISVLDIVDSENVDTLSSYDYYLISTRRVYGQFSDWETFDVTSAVERWVKSGQPIHQIEIRIETLIWRFSFGFMDIKTIPNDNKEPLLLVYSNDDSKHSEHVDERHELISHELSSHSVSGSKTKGKYNKPSDMYLENASEPKLSRRKRSKGFHRSSVCRRRPMFVNFEDINWHTWIIAPRGYQAYQCVGKCYFPVNEHLSPSKHAIIQSMLHSHYPKKAVRACCVPTKLEPISILYVDEQGVITYKYKYDGMVVAECGCR